MPTTPNNKEAFNQESFSTFKVILYRLNIPGKLPKDLTKVWTENSEYDINSLFNKTDYADAPYRAASDAIDEGDGCTLFNKVLDAINASIAEQLEDEFINSLRGAPGDAPAVESGSPFFDEIDVTPLVLSVNTELSIDGINSATIRMVDPVLNEFSVDEYNKYLYNSRNTPFEFLNKNRLDVSGLVDQLKSLRFMEFDLIRIFAYSGVVPPDQYRNVLYGKLIRGIPVMESKAKELATEAAIRDAMKYYLRPMFTGVISSPCRSNSAGSSPTIDLNCMGIQRVFSQSVVIGSQAMMNVVANNTPSLPDIGSDVNVWETRYTNMSAYDIILDLFSHYLSVRGVSLGDAEKDDVKKNIVLIPDLAEVCKQLWKTVLINGKEVSLLIPFVQLMVLLHIIKTRYNEFFLSFDDKLPTEINEYVRMKNAAPTAVKAELKQYALHPYLLTLRDTFSLYDASYMSACDLFGAIKETTFMEMFEDRSGQFHHRAPRYNLACSLHNIQPKNIISVRNVIDDSSNYTSITVHKMGDLIGPYLVSGYTYSDRLSILRYGFRKPQVINNPNCTNSDFAAYLPKFMREYGAMKGSRRAEVTIIGDVSIDIGEMVIFRISDKAEDWMSKEIYVGYVMGISESMPVDGMYTQKLSLGFVRNAPILINRGSKNLLGTMWDATKYDISSVSTPDGSGGFVKKISVNKDSMWTILPRPVVDVMDLANKYNGTDSSTYYGWAGGVNNNETPKQIRARISKNAKAAIAANIVRVDDLCLSAAVSERMRIIYEELSGEVKNIASVNKLTIDIATAAATAFAAFISPGAGAVVGEVLNSGNKLNSNMLTRFVNDLKEAFRDTLGRYSKPTQLVGVLPQTVHQNVTITQESTYSPILDLNSALSIVSDVNSHIGDGQFANDWKNIIVAPESGVPINVKETDRIIRSFCNYLDVLVDDCEKSVEADSEEITRLFEVNVRLLKVSENTSAGAPAAQAEPPSLIDLAQRVFFALENFLERF